MAGAWLLASGLCWFQKCCFITLQLSKLCKLSENREHTEHISNSNCQSEYLFHYVRSPKSRIQEFQGSTNIQKSYSWRPIVNLVSHSFEDAHLNSWSYMNQACWRMVGQIMNAGLKTKKKSSLVIATPIILKITHEELEDLRGFYFKSGAQ